MAYCEEHYEQMAQDLGATPGLSETRMFGGLCFTLNGNMLCGVHKGGAMYRVGKDNGAKALALTGARKMAFTGRPMGGFIELDEDGLCIDETRDALIRYAVSYVGAMPAK